MTYEQWDRIADGYTPLLLVLYIAFSIYYFRAGNWAAPLQGLIGIFCCYVVMLLDNFFQLWKVLSLDYSTHSAVAFALVYFHLHRRKFLNPIGVAFSVSLILYYALILYQQYHTALDILSTLGIVGPMVFLIYRIPLNNPRSQTRNSQHRGG